jgi:hypothetical protein
VQSLLAGMSFSEAYRSAGFVGKSNWFAREIANHPDIVARLEYIKGEFLRQRQQDLARVNCAAVSKDELMVEAEGMRMSAMRSNRPAAALRAIEFKAQLAGFLKIERRPRSAARKI